MGDKCGHTYHGGLTLTTDEDLDLTAGTKWRGQLILKSDLWLTEIDLVHKTRLTTGQLFHKITSKYSQIDHEISLMTTNYFK